MKNQLLFASSLLALLSPVLSSAPRADEKLILDKDWLELLPWRSIGPANMSGRITALAVCETDPSLYWVATASGGLLKTTNAGATYAHQFDHEKVVSIGDMAVAPSDPQIVWVGTGESNPRNSVSYGNGVYKSTDGGETWEHMGLDETFQTGAIKIHPENPDVVYVGALGRLYGPNEERGLYKTTDGGKKWEKVLYVDDKTGVIDVDMHPTEPDTLLVATYERERDGFDTNDPAKKWGPGSGIHRTTDGGKTWTKVTEGLPTVNLGRVGIDWYREDPNVVYAVIESERIASLPDDAAWIGLSAGDAEIGAKVSRVAEGGPAEAAGLQKDDIVIIFGDEKVLKDADLDTALRHKKAGDKVTVEYVRERELMVAEVVLGSMPEGSRERRPFGSGLGGQRENVQEEQGREAEQTGGVYRSADAGATWTRINSLNPRPMYFSEIRVDPSDENFLYVLGISLYRSKDGGKTFTSDGGRGGVHVDHHALWVDPADGRHMILGNDGGIYVTHDRMEHWDHHNHVAIGQFYHVTVDNQPLYHVYGGLQDNGSWGAPNRSRNGGGVLNTDWISIGGGDGFVCRVDPEDPDQVYYESQNGGIGRWNLRTGDRGFMRPRGGGVSLRFNWETPFQLSNHAPRVYLTAGNYVFRSLNKGDGLERISPEITATDRGSATALSESPRDKDVIYVGTDDGALWMTKDGGETWVDLFDPYGHEDNVEADAAVKEWLAGRFTELDADEDGKLAAGEIPEEMLPLLSPADFDGDGEITAEEFARVSVWKIPPKEEEAEEEAPAVPAADDPVSGEWKAKLTGEGVTEEAREFTLKLSLKADGKVTGTFKTSTKEGAVQSGTYDAEKKELVLTYEIEAGKVTQTGTLEGNKMTGQLETAGGLIRVPFEAERVGGGAAAPAEASAAAESGEGPVGPATPIPADDPLTGKWKGQIVGDEVPPGAAEFDWKLTLKPDGKVEGSTSSQMGDAKMKDGAWNAEEKTLTFVLVGEVGDMTAKAELKEEGKLEGSFNLGGLALDFEAERESAPAPQEPEPEPTAAEEAPAEPTAEDEGRDRERPRKKRKRKENTIGNLLPKRMWVSSLEASRHKAGRVYVTFDGHRSDLDDPFVYVSDDYGVTWEALSENLPRGSSRVLREDLKNEDLLYLGTEFGAWVTVDRGQSWKRVGDAFPTVSVHDFAQHALSGDVVVGTHGRSLWVVDVTALRQFTADALEAKAWLYEPAKVIRWRSEPRRGSSGLRRFRGQDPSSNATIYYSLGKKPRAMTLTVQDVNGDVIRKLEAEDGRGLHRVSWDLRRERRPDEEQQASTGRRFRGPRRGAPVPEGRYLIVLEADGTRLTQELLVENDPYYPTWHPGVDEEAEEILELHDDEEELEAAGVLDDR